MDCSRVVEETRCVAVESSTMIEKAIEIIGGEEELHVWNHQMHSDCYQTIFDRVLTSAPTSNTCQSSRLIQLIKCTHARTIMYQVINLNLHESVATTSVDWCCTPLKRQLSLTLFTV